MLEAGFFYYSISSTEFNLIFGSIIEKYTQPNQDTMKNIFLATVLTILSFSGIAQTYKKVFYKDQTIENNDIKITITGAVSTPAGIKFKVRIFNKTDQYVVYKPSESVFKLEGKNYNPEEKWLVIRPNDDDSKVIDLKGKDYMIAANFDFVMEGLYKFSTDAKGVNCPEFVLPPSKNDFKAGGFDIVHVKNKKTTARTDVTFKAKYVGDKIGIFEPNKVAVKMPDGKEYANYHSDQKPSIFAKGEEDAFNVSFKDIPTSSGDMQTATMNIIWRDAFKEITPDKMLPTTLNMMFDKETTDLKNK